jgi:peptidoglycan/xylan/chitin deacetylase (PgdA/CDA1 family)
LDQAVAQMHSGALPARALAISFDDGYADNHEIALPILQRHGLKATFFIATAFLNGGRMWNDSVIEAIRMCKVPVLDLAGTVAASLGVMAVEGLPAKQAAIGRVIGAVKYLTPQERIEWVNAIVQAADTQLPSDLMMATEQIVALQNAGMQIGAHTANHPILAKLSRSRARQEIAESKQALEAMLGRKIDLFAYPNGKPGTDYSAETVELVRELGFAAAFTTVAVANSAASDPFQLARYTPWERTRLRFGVKLMKNYLRRQES